MKSEFVIAREAVFPMFFGVREFEIGESAGHEEEILEQMYAEDSRVEAEVVE